MTTKTTNIFMTAYEQPENKLTYAFLSLLEHLDDSNLKKILYHLGIDHEVYDHTVRLVYGGGETNPDGSLHLNSTASNGVTVFLENKTWRRKLETSQISGHIRGHLKRPTDILLVITSSEEDKPKLDSLHESRIRFTTWNQLINFLDTDKERLKIEGDKDAFIVSQFVEYVEISGEGWRAKMVERELIDAMSQSNQLRERLEQFERQSMRLLQSFVEANLEKPIYDGFEEQIRFDRVYNGEGLYALSFEPGKARLEPWLFVGIRHNERHHKIQFKKPNAFEPEYLILLGVKPQNREKILTQSGIKEAVADLQKENFQVNIDGQSSTSPWDFCWWHEPMSTYADKKVSDLRDILRNKLSALLSSEFYRKFEQANA
jgi:hypothetical protein